MQISWRVGGEEIIFDFVGFWRDVLTALDIDISLGVSLLLSIRLVRDSVSFLQSMVSEFRWEKSSFHTIDQLPMTLQEMEHKSQDLQ